MVLLAQSVLARPDGDDLPGGCRGLSSDTPHSLLPAGPISAGLNDG